MNKVSITAGRVDIDAYARLLSLAKDMFQIAEESDIALVIAIEHSADGCANSAIGDAAMLRRMVETLSAKIEEAADVNASLGRL